MQTQSSKQILSSKRDNYRKSIKFMPILGQKSRDLNKKYENFVQQRKIKDSQNSLSNKDTSQCQSNFTVFSQQSQENHYYNAFLEKYQLLEKLGQGANGCVFKCRYKTNNRFYAAKKIKIQKQHISQLKKNFISLKELNHSSVCRYKALQIDQNQRFAFLVMQYLPFPSLADYKIKSQGELKIIVKEITSAINYIHNRNLCHRDIKPENILYDQKNKKIKVIDFGISKKTFSRGTRRDMLTIIGSHFYLAPEVYNGGGYDQRIDIWALGITIFKQITGYTPFESEFHSDTISNILKGEVNFDDQIWKKYSPFSQHLVSQLLKGRKQRITLAQASKHLWFHSECQPLKQTKLKKMKSYNISLCEDFHHEFHNKSRNALSRQEGSLSSIEQNQEICIKLNKRINLMNVKQYCLQDSDDEDLVIKPKSNPIRQKFCFGTSLLNHI